MMNSLMPNYKRLPVTFTQGEGAYVWDTNEKRYLDALAGIAVCGLGHAHPAVKEALCEQAGRLLHTSNLYGITQQQALADKLVELSGMETVFFANSGAEANEAAIKLARLYAHQQGIKNPKIIVTEGSFHGRTLATLSATGNRKIQMGFEPLVSGFVRVPYNDIETIQRIANSVKDVVAVLVEPVQGEGGVNIPDTDYLNRLRGFCDSHNWLLMLDEIQTGIGRTGQWFAFQHNKIQPDVMSLAKGLGNGVPIGACLAHGKVAETFQPGTHGSTFGGNPLACSAALAVLNTVENEQLVARAADLGQRMLADFQTQLASVPGVKDIRGKGLMFGIELDRPCAELVTRALEQGLLINVTAGSVIRLLPPLILSDEQAQEIVNTVSHLVQEFLN